MVQKIGNITLETSADTKDMIKTNITFNDTDVGTAVLRFNLTNNGYPLLVNPDNTNTIIFLVAQDGYFEKRQLTFDDPLNGKVSIVLSEEFLKHSGLAKGQIYINVDEGNSIQSTITKTKFAFNIEESLINTIPTIIEMKELRVFKDLENEIRESYEEIKTMVSGASAVAEEMNRVLTNTKTDMETYINSVKSDFEELKTQFNADVEISTNDAKTSIEATKNKAIEDLEKLNGYDTTDWQKAKLTNDDGSLKRINGLDFNNPDVILGDKTQFVYVSGATNYPENSSGTLMYLVASIDYKRIEYRPNGINKVFIKQQTAGVWSEWTEITSINTRKVIGTIGSEGNNYTNVLTLPAGLYECTIPAQANLVNAPFDPNRGAYVAEIDVTEGANKRKQIRLRQNYHNIEYITTVHTDNNFRGWKKVVTEEYGKQQNADTGWIQWQLENGAVNRNETTGEGTLYRNEYRVITTNGITRAHIRFNISNITPNAIVGRIPEKMVPKAQTGLLRSGLSRNPVVYTINIDGSIKLMVHSNDIGSWDAASYCIGEHSWIVDVPFFDNVDIGGSTGIEGETPDDLVGQDVVENPNGDFDDHHIGDPTLEEEHSDEDILIEDTEYVPDYGDVLDEIDDEESETIG